MQLHNKGNRHFTTEGYMSSQYSTKNFQRKVSIFATLCLLGTALLVAVFSISPFYSKLAKQQYASFQEGLDKTSEQISTVLSEINIILNGVTNSEESGRLMEFYSANQVSEQSFLALSRKNLTSAIKKYPAIRGIARLDSNGKVLVQIGQTINSIEKLNNENIKFKTELYDGEVKLVSRTVIRSGSGQIAGYDFYLIDIKEMINRKKLMDSVHSGEQIYLVDQNQQLVFASADEKRQIASWETIKNALTSGKLPSETELFQSSVGLIGWNLYRLSPRKLIMASVNEQIKFVALFSFMLLVVGSVSINYLLQPLTGKLILHTNDLEAEVEKKTWELQQELNQKKLAEKAIKSLNETLTVNNKIITNTLSMLNQDLRDAVIGQKDAIAMFEKDGLSSPNHEFLRMIQCCTEAIEKSVNHAADFAARDFDLYAFEPASFNLDSVLDSWMNLLKTKAMQDNRSLNLTIGENIPNDLVGDPRRMGQILAYVTEHAIKLALPDSPITIFVEKEFSKSDEVGLALSVSCDGLIFSEEEVFLFNKYFEKLEESNFKLAQNIPPANLVLAAKLARSHSGQLWIETLPSGGTRFNIYMPFTLSSSKIIKSDENRLATGAWMIGNLKPTKSTSIVRSSSETVKILLAEDSDINCKLITSLLEKKHCEVSTAKTPSEIYESLVGKKYDMIFLDTELPFANAVEIAEKIRANKDKNTIPIVALGTAADPEKWHNNGLFNDYIQKPIDPRELYKSLAKWV